jgi:hypothetical protein
MSPNLSEGDRYDLPYRLGTILRVGDSHIFTRRSRKEAVNERYCTVSGIIVQFAAK